MTKTDHLAKAKQYIAKGEDYYRKAAEEIKAERDENETPWREIADRLEKSHVWCQKLVRSLGNSNFQNGELVVDWGNKPQPERDENTAKKLARQNPEAIVEAIAEAPKEAQDKIATGIVALPNKALSTSVQKPERKPRAPREIERQLAQAVIDLWDVGERLMDEAPPSGESRVRMLAYAEKAERIGHGLAQLLQTGEIEDELRDLLAEGVGA